MSFSKNEDLDKPVSHLASGLYTLCQEDICAAKGLPGVQNSLCSLSSVTLIPPSKPEPSHRAPLNWSESGVACT